MLRRHPALSDKTSGLYCELVRGKKIDKKIAQIAGGGTVDYMSDCQAGGSF